MRKEALLETSTSAISRPQRERKVAAESVIGVNFYKLSRREASRIQKKKRPQRPLSYSLRVRFFEYFALRLANRGRERQRDNQQGKYDAEGHVEPAEQGAISEPQILPMPKPR